MSGYWSFRDTNRPQGGLKPMSAAVLPEGVRLAQEKNDNTGDVQLETEELHEFAPAAEASPLLLEVEVDRVVRNAQRDWWRARFGVVGFDPAAQEALEPLPCHQACDTGVSHVDPLSSSDAADAATARALISRADAILRSSSVEVQAPSHTQAVMGERRHGQSSAWQQQKGRIRKAAPDKKERPPPPPTTTTTTAPPRFLQRMAERAEARRQARESLHKKHNTVAPPEDDVKKEERGSSSDGVAATTPLEGKSTQNNKLADASFHALVQLIISDGHHSNNNNHSPQVRKELHTVASHYHTAHTLRRTLRAWHGRFQSAAVRRTEWKAATVKREQDVVRLLLEHTRVCQSVVCEEASSRSVVENAFRLEQRHQSLRDRSVHSQLVLARGYFTMWAEFCTHRERQRSALRYRKYLEECARGVLESMGH